MAAGSEAAAPTQPAAPSPAAAAAQPLPVSATVSTVQPGGGYVHAAAERLMAEQKISAGAISATGPGGRILKEDVQRAVEARAAQETAPVAAATATAQSPHSPLLSPAAELQARGEIVPADLSRTGSFRLNFHRLSARRRIGGNESDPPPHCRTAGRGAAFRGAVDHV